MVEATQFEQRLAFEPRTAPVDPAGAAQQNDRPDYSGGAGRAQSSAGDEPTDRVELSPEAQRIAANGPSNAPRPDTPQTDTRESLDPSVETSATSDIGSTVGAAADTGASTNQVTSFEGERTGNDTRNETEAGRTLGQVIDTFA